MYKIAIKNISIVAICNMSVPLEVSLGLYRFTINYGRAMVILPNGNEVLLTSELPDELKINSTLVAHGFDLYAVGGQRVSDDEPSGSYGFSSSNSIYKLMIADPIEDSVFEKQEYILKEGRQCAASISFSGKIVVLGGYSSSSPYEDDPAETDDLCLNTTEVFDPATGSVERRPDMIKPRDSFSCFEHSDMLYAVGGDQDGKLSIEVTDNSMQEWRIVTEYTGERRGCTFHLEDSKIFVIGGRHHSEKIDYFDLVTMKWCS